YSRGSDTVVPSRGLQRRDRAGASCSLDPFLWTGIAFYGAFRTALAGLPRVGILANSSRNTRVEKRARRFACESADHCHGPHIRSVSSDLCPLRLAAETPG